MRASLLCRVSESERKKLLAELRSLGDLEPRAPGAEDVEAMNARQRRIELLYALAGRDSRDNLAHGLYTGLAQESPV